MKNLLIVLVVLIPLATYSQQSTEIDKIFADWDSINVPGGALGIIQDGKQIYAKGYGSADMEHDIPIAANTVFYIGSVSKQFVTFCVLLLEEQGKLDLDDKIQQYLPDFPEYGDPLTIRHFIHHTSGVRDYLTLLALKGRNYLDHATVEEVYELIKSQNSLNFKPGDQELYSNSCYFMLAMIVEKAAGESIRGFAQKNIFTPLGMKNTLFYDDNTNLIKNRAFSYQKTKDGFNNLINRFDLVGSGGVYSTVEDLYLWDQNFYNNKLGSGGQTIINKMHENGQLNDGTTINYAFALVNGEYKGLRTVSHTGSLAGYRAVQLRFPDQRFTVTILANRNDASPLGKAYQVAEIYLKDKMKEKSVPKKEETGKRKAVSVSDKKLKSYVGHYWNERVGFKAEIALVDGQLYYKDRSNEYKLIPRSTTEFIPEQDNGTLSFKSSNEGKMEVILKEGRSTYRLSRFQPVTYSVEKLKEYAGSFYSDELNFFYNLKMEEAKLVLYLDRVRDDQLVPVKENTFRSGALILNFNDERSGFEANAGRVKHLKFERVVN